MTKWQRVPDYHLFKGGNGITQSTPFADKQDVLIVAAIVTEVLNTLLVTIRINVCLHILQTRTQLF